MSIRKASCRLLQGLLILAVTGCASLTGDSRLADGTRGRSRLVVRDDKGNARANAPASLASSEPTPSKKDKDAKEVKDVASKPEEEKDTAKAVEKAVEAVNQLAKAETEIKPPSDADKSEKEPPIDYKPKEQFTLQSAFKSVAEQTDKKEKPEKDAELYVLPASLSLSRPKPKTGGLAMALDGENKQLAKVDLPTPKLPQDPPKIDPPSLNFEIPSDIGGPKDDDVSLEVEAPASADSKKETPATTATEVASGDAESDEPTAIMPAVSRSNPLVARDSVEKEPGELPPLVPAVTLSPAKADEPVPPPPAVAALTREAKQPSAPEPSVSSPPAETVDLSPLLSAIEKLKTTIDEEEATPPNASASVMTEESKQEKTTDAIPKPTDVVALKPASQETEKPQLTVPESPAQPKEQLKLNALAICRQIHGFGQVEPLDPHSLHPNQQVLLYVEVENFESKLEGTQYLTELASIATIETTDGVTVSSVEFDPIVDRCDSRRSDFYCHFLFRLPESLAPGDYVLRLRIKDLQCGEFGESQLALKIVSLTK